MSHKDKENMLKPRCVSGHYSFKSNYLNTYSSTKYFKMLQTKIKCNFASTIFFLVSYNLKDNYKQKT